jgi:hypothetical protein
MRNLLFIFIAATIALSACKSPDKTNAIRLPHSIGSMGELTVVADKSIFKGTIREALDSVVDVPQPYFFNTEGYFRMRDITPVLFKNVSKSYHTIWIIKVEGDELSTVGLPAPYNKMSDSLSKLKNDTIPVRVFAKNDVWAYPQQVIFIFAKTKNDLYKYLWENREVLRQKTLDMEMKSHIIKAKQEGIDSLSKETEKPFGFRIEVPKNFRVARYEETSPKNKFMWLRRETPNIGQSIIIYTQPYTSEKQLIPERIVLNRDSLTKQYITGPGENCYMGTELTFPFRSEVKETAGMYSVEMRAWWKTYNCFMGGPFYSVTMVDEKHSVLLTLEGFVYSPKYDKTQYIRPLEAIIKTLKWVD